tara:strand:+ start:5140 stop:5817 length:678 start_codon:yes stop_codon:yes gene_type:complete
MVSKNCDERQSKIKKKKENAIARTIYRPLSEPIAIFLSRFNVTPNQVTVVSVFISIFSGLFFTFGEWKYSFVGAIFLQLSVLTDHVDGSLARFTNQSSRFGELWDDMANKLIKFFVLLGMSFGAYRQIGNPMILLVGTIAIFNITYSSFLVSFFHNLKKELDLRESLSIMPEKKGTFFPASLFVYAVITFGGLTNLLWLPIFFLATFGMVWIKQILNAKKAFKNY